ncbi:hypothetical protein DIE18_03400 [Burkholderia sp. Bp9125]|nr:hypothetical protein DIE18_03400 [Burkholderia sp. Bp9125]
MPVEITPFQRLCVDALRKEPNGIASTSAILSRLHRSARIAVSSAMRGLERKGLAQSFPSDNSEWAVTLWALTRLGKAELQLPAPKS